MSRARTRAQIAAIRKKKSPTYKAHVAARVWETLSKRNAAKGPL